MAGPLIDIITSTDPQTRNRSLDSVCRSASREELVAAGAELDAFQRRSDNLYERVRALFFLYAIHRFYLPCKPGVRQCGLIPFRGFKHLLVALRATLDKEILDLVEIVAPDGLTRARRVAQRLYSLIKCFLVVQPDDKAGIRRRQKISLAALVVADDRQAE